jgi:hypothetical protein
MFYDLITIRLDTDVVPMDKNVPLARVSRNELQIADDIWHATNFSVLLLNFIEWAKA